MKKRDCETVNKQTNQIPTVSFITNKKILECVRSIYLFSHALNGNNHQQGENQFYCLESF